MYTQSNTQERPIFFKLEWSSSSCCKKWVDYIQLKNIEDSDGTLQYRSLTTCGNSFRLDRLTGGEFLAHPPKKFPERSENVLKAWRKKRQLRLEFHRPSLKLDLFMRIKTFRRPIFRIRYWGYTIEVSPSAEAGFWNRSVALEAHLLGPGLPSLSYGQSVSPSLVFKYQMDTYPSTCACSAFMTGRFSVYFHLIEAMARSPAINSSSNQDQVSSSNIPEYILNIEPEQMLACFFYLVENYRQFYATIKIVIPIYVLNFILVIVLIINTFSPFSKKNYQ